MGALRYSVEEMGGEVEKLGLSQEAAFVLALEEVNEQVRRVVKVVRRNPPACAMQVINKLASL